MFISLPYLFKGMPGGELLVIVFFVAVLLAGLTSLVNLYEAPIETLQANLHFSRPMATAVIGGIGAVSAVCIQGIVSGWMDFVSIYVCPLGAGLAGIMFAWVWGKKKVEAEVSKGRAKPVGSWYYPLYKYVFCGLTFIVLIAGILCGGIG
jgi:NSS family neurotransmitter:Na+ symporter